MVPPPDDDHLGFLLWSRVRHDGDCWIWEGCVNSGGYGSVFFERERWMTHRLAFASCYGWLPPRPLEVAHVCETRACINPDHLEAQTQSENRAYVHRHGCSVCGLPWDEANTYWHNGRRRCRNCNRARSRALRARRRTA
jgi:hypothetical protein